MECDSAPLSENEDFLDDDTCYEEDIAFIEPLITKKNFQFLKSKLKIQLNPLKGLKKVTMEKMICQSCLFLKKEKTLTFIVFKTIKKEPSMFYSRARKSVFLCCSIWFNVP